MYKVIALSFALALPFNSVLAQEKSANATGDYEMDLGQVHGAIDILNILRKECNKAFPDQSSINNAAYDDWRGKYRPFLQEIERHFTALALEKTAGDGGKYMKLLDLTNNNLMAAFESMREEFLKVCPVYPAYLESQRMDLEKYYVEQVEVIRERQLTNRSRPTPSARP